MTTYTKHDAELVALGEQLRNAWEKQRRFGEAHDLSDAKNYAMAETLAEGCQKLVRKIEVLQATTRDAMRTKALAVAWCHSDNPGELVDFGAESNDLHIATDIINDLLADDRTAYLREIAEQERLAAAQALAARQAEEKARAEEVQVVEKPVAHDTSEVDRSLSKVFSYRIMRLPEVSRLLGVSRPTIYRLIRDGKFPKPIKLGSTSGWRSDELEAYIKNLRNGD